MTLTITLDTNDILDWSYTREHWRPTELLECRGFTAGASPQPIFSRWPGLAPGQGNQNSAVERLIANASTGQTELNQRCGRRGAAADGIYVDANGALQMALDLELTLPTGYHVADFYDEYVAINLTTSLRGLDMSGQLFVLRSVRLETGDDGTLQTVWTLRTATNGVAGVTYVPPQESDNGLPPYNPPSWDFNLPTVVEPPFVDPNNLPKGAQSIFAIADNGYWLRCGPDLTGGGFDVPAASGGPIWERGSLGVSGTTKMAALLPFSVGTASIDGVVCTTTGVYKVEDCGGATPSVTLLHSFARTASEAYIETTIADPNWILAVYYVGGATAPGTYAVYSTDGGASFTEVQITAHRTTNPGTVVKPALYMSIHTAGVAYTFAFTSTGNPAAAALFKTTNYGASWAQVSSGTLNTDPGITLTALHFPWHNNASETVLFHGKRNNAGTPASRVYRVSGGTATDITPVAGGFGYGARLTRSLMTSTGDRNTLVGTGLSSNETLGLLLAKSRDGGTTWTALDTDTHYLHCHIPDNRDVVYLWGESPTYFGYSADFLVTIDDRSGNIPTNFAWVGDVLNIWGL